MTILYIKRPRLFLFFQCATFIFDVLVAIVNILAGNILLSTIFIILSVIMGKLFFKSLKDVVSLRKYEFTSIYLRDFMDYGVIQTQYILLHNSKNKNEKYSILFRDEMNKPMMDLYLLQEKRIGFEQLITVDVDELEQILENREL